MSDRAKGILLAVLASLAWGTTTACARYLTDTRGVDPLLLAACRFTIAALCLLVYVAARGQGSRLVAAMAEAPRFFMLGLLGMVGLGVFVFASAKYTYSVNANLITNANAIFVAAFAFLVGERVPPARIVGLAIGLAGCFLAVAGRIGFTLGGANDLLGGGLALGAAVVWALYTVLGKSAVQRWGGLIATTAAMCFGSATLVVMAAVAGTEPLLTVSEFLVLLYMGVAPTALAFVIWYVALEYVPANLIGPTQYVAPLVGIALGHLLLSEPIKPVFVAGAALVFLGVGLALSPERRQAPCQR